MRRSPGPDTVGGTDVADAVDGPGETEPAVAVAAERLSAGAREWVGANAAYLNSPEALALLPVTPRVKALLQLALLCRYWEKAAPGDGALTQALGVVEEAGRRPDFLPLMAGDPVNARLFQLVWAALAPPGVSGEWRRDALERLTADGYLTPGRKSPYLHLGTRFYADLAGATTGWRRIRSCTPPAWRPGPADCRWRAWTSARSRTRCSTSAITASGTGASAWTGRPGDGHGTWWTG